MPGGHDKVPPMVGGAMPLVNPRLNTGFTLSNIEITSFYISFCMFPFCIVDLSLNTYQIFWEMFKL